MYKKILIPTDGSENSNKVIEQVVEMAEKSKLEILIINIVPNLNSLISFNLPEETYKIASAKQLKNSTEIIDQLKRKYRQSKALIRYKSLQGDPAFVICQEAKNEKIDEIIMAGRGFGKTKGILLGNISNRVVEHADCSVLIVR
ncbi:MAG: universal stress protein [Peptococcaceae bacterium]|nr:universal stress protein [Peptococcaceae bacterium]